MYIYILVYHHISSYITIPYIIIIKNGQKANTLQETRSPHLQTFKSRTVFSLLKNDWIFYKKVWASSNSLLEGESADLVWESAAVCSSSSWPLRHVLQQQYQ